MKDAGPIADPWMTLAWMTATAEIVKHAGMYKLIQVGWSVKLQQVEGDSCSSWWFTFFDWTTR